MQTIPMLQPDQACKAMYTPQGVLHCYPRELHHAALPKRKAEQRSVTVPQIQSMKDYILLHYKDALQDELCQRIGTMNFTHNKGTLEPIPDTCRITHIEFWHDSTMSFTAYVSMSIDLIVDDKDIERFERQKFQTELLFDMEDGIAFQVKAFHPVSSERMNDHVDGRWLLNDYLIPILRKDEIETAAEHMLYLYCPDALKNPTKHDAYALANRMGLNVIHLPLYQREKTLSILFFCAGNVLIQKKHKDDAEEEPPVLVAVPSQTIVINSNVLHKDHC